MPAVSVLLSTSYSMEGSTPARLSARSGLPRSPSRPAPPSPGSSTSSFQSVALAMVRSELLSQTPPPRGPGRCRWNCGRCPARDRCAGRPRSAPAAPPPEGAARAASRRPAGSTPPGRAGARGDAPLKRSGDGAWGTFLRRRCSPSSQEVAGRFSRNLHITSARGVSPRPGVPPASMRAPRVSGRVQTQSPAKAANPPRARRSTQPQQAPRSRDQHRRDELHAARRVHDHRESRPARASEEPVKYAPKHDQVPVPTRRRRGSGAPPRASV